MMKRDKQPIIETIINTSAIALTGFGVTQLTIKGNSAGGLAYAFSILMLGMSLEFFKYVGRKKNLW